MFVDAYFFDSSLNYPSAPALWVDGVLYSYADLARRALLVGHSLKAALAERSVDPLSGDAASGPHACLLFALRSVNAYAGLLGTLHAGYGYIPLSPNAPAERNLQIIRNSGVRTVLIDSTWKADWDALVATAPAGVFDDFLILHYDVDKAAETLPEATLRAESAAYAQRDSSDLAYVLFTSGSTGTPKGVQISHASISSYIGNEAGLRPRAEGGDRYSQFFDLTTDPSVEEIFLCWANGGCLYAMPKNDPLSVSAFLKEHQLTHFSSVPSTIAFLKQYRKLKPGMFPHLKLSIFGGEAFRGELLKTWAEAAPNAEIRNMYGPTETTVAVAKFTINAAQVQDDFAGVLPIGKPMKGVELVIVDETGEPVPPGEPGELLIGGVQLALGYIGASSEDMQRFFPRTFAGRHATRWYRTGDLVRASNEGAASSSEGEGDLLYRFLGRIDSQVKIRGNRIELQEVESALAAASGGAMTAAIALPADDLGVSPGIIGFVGALARGTAAVDDTTVAAENLAILQQCRLKLPAFAVPLKVVRLDEFPLNLAGKLDRLALTRHYLQASGGTAR